MTAKRQSLLWTAISATMLLCTQAANTLLADEPTGLQVAAALENVLVEAIAQSEKSVVAIARVKHGDADFGANVERSDPFGLRTAIPSRPSDADFIPNEYATGVVVDPGGLILTAHHVLRPDSEYWVTTAGRKTYKARVVGADPRSDLAVLSVDAHDLVAIKLGDASKLKKGQIVLALGNPYAIARDGQVSASWGIVSNLARKDGPVPDRDSQPPATKPALHHYGTLIQTDAKLNLGTSGGALLNLKGEMVGLTLSLSAALGYEQAAGFALPVDDMFRRALESLKKGREVEYGFLGVQLNALTLAERAEGKQGVRVRDVVQGTPAARSGLAPGNLVVRVGDQPVYDADHLMLSLGMLPPESEVRLTVERNDGLVSSVPVQLAKYFVHGEKTVTERPSAWRGIRVDFVTASSTFTDWARQGKIDPQGAVLITEIEQDSPAWKEGLRAGMMISHVGSQRVATPKEFQAAVTGKAGPVPLRLNLPADERPVRAVPDAG